MSTNKSNSQPSSFFFLSYCHCRCLNIFPDTHEVQMTISMKLFDLLNYLFNNFIVFVHIMVSYYFEKCWEIRARSFLLRIPFESLLNPTLDWITLRAWMTSGSSKKSISGSKSFPCWLVFDRTISNVTITHPSNVPAPTMTNSMISFLIPKGAASLTRGSQFGSPL